MTTPIDITEIIPSKAKAWVGLIGSLLTLAIPFVLQISTSLEQPWPTVIGAVVAILTALGIYKAPYKPAGTVLAPDTPIVAAEIEATPPSIPTTEKSVTLPTSPPDGGYQNPWKKK